MVALLLLDSKINKTERSERTEGKEEKSGVVVHQRELGGGMGG